MTTNIENLRREISLSDTAISYGVDLKRDGDEWISCCPFHSESTPSFTVFPGKDHVQRFHCFGCGEKGDVLDFVQKIKGVDIKEAISILGGGNSGPNIAPRQVEARDVYAGVEPIEPAGDIAVGKRVAIYNPKRAGTELEWGHMSPSMVFPYRRDDGSLIGYVLRRDFKDGGKETPMVMRVRLPSGKECWSRYPFPKPRTLYRLERLRKGQVIVVEGEKVADKLALASKRCVISWAGGTQGARYADWSPLAGCDVVIWPDADKPGSAVAAEIVKTILPIAKRVRLIDVSGKKGGWDAADGVDDGWTKDDIDRFMRDRIGPNIEVKHEPEPSPQAVVDDLPKKGKATVAEARTVSQEQPKQATVTQLHTRKTVKADDWWMSNLVTNEDGKTKPSVTKNWSLYLENHPAMAGVFAFDAFKMRVMLMRNPPWEEAGASWLPRVLTDRDYSEAVMWLEGFHMTPKASNIQAVIQTVAEHASFDRLREYLDGLVWDQTSRVETWMSDCLGVDDTPYARTVGLCWLVSSVARGLKPGCKVDTMPILEGTQGARKSTAIQLLYSEEFFTDELSDIGSKDAMMEMQGVWGLEVAEMHRFSAAETNAVKKFLSRQTDRFRPPYGRTVIEAPRRVVLNGTINPEGNAYLRDPTGARRFWPLTVGKIDTDRISHERDQLWAEAVHLFKSGTNWWVQDENISIVEVEQEKRTDVDVWMAVVSPLIKSRSSISQRDIFKELGIPDKDTDFRHAARVGRIMKKLKWEMYRDRSDGDDRVVFRNPKTLNLEPETENLDW